MSPRLVGPTPGTRQVFAHAALGLVHELWSPIAGEFDDWWHKIVEQGVLADSALAAITVGEPKITDISTAPPATVADETPAASHSMLRP